MTARPPARAARTRLLRRMTVGFPAESGYVSRRAFRVLADADVRTLVSRLPSPR